MRFSIITPSFKQLDWLRLCVASVRDQVQVKTEKLRIRDSEKDSSPEHSESPLERTDPDNKNFSFSASQDFSISVEHIIQDAGSPGIEEFAREVGADFYRDGGLVFAGDQSRIESRESGNERRETGAITPSTQDSRPSPLQFTPRPSTPDPRPYRIAVHCEADAGMYDAINRGIEKSSGVICAWLNCDEQYLEDTLRKVASIFCARKHVDVLLGDALLVDAKLEPVCYRRIILPNKWHTRLAYLHSLSCSMFFKRSILPSPPLSTRWKVISDAILMTYFLESKRNIHACKQLLAAYAFTGVNLSAGPLKAEKDQWWSENLWPPKYSTPFVLFHHRLRRLWSGAYGTHRVQCSLYTFDSCHQREMLADSPIPGTWPQAQA